MNLTQLQKHSIACIGFGTENYYLLEYLFSCGHKKPVTIFETASLAELKKRYPQCKFWNKIILVKDTRSSAAFKSYSLLVKSPGAYFPKGFRTKVGKMIISPIQLFFDLSPSKNIIGITGTKGKGTTSSLIYEMLIKAKKRAWLGGNIGVAPFSFIKKIKKTDWIVLELSSFQLEDTKSSPMISVLTNFSPEHLKPADPHNPNHHPSLSHYWNSKLNIARHQAKDHVFIINSKLKTKIQKEKLKGKIVYFGKSNLSSKLPGEHNKENIAAATEVARIIGIPKQSIAHTVKNFKGLPYRLERLGEKNNIEYYNDSFSTVPDSTITAINSFSKPIVLLAGGADKDSNFTALAKLIKKRITYLVLFKGPGTNRLLKFLQKINFNKKNTVVVNSMKDAVRAARKKAVPGTIILLSPACASFGVFKNYKDRGNQFKQEFLRQK